MYTRTNRPACVVPLLLLFVVLISLVSLFWPAPGGAEPAATKGPPADYAHFAPTCTECTGAPADAVVVESGGELVVSAKRVPGTSKVVRI